MTKEQERRFKSDLAWAKSTGRQLLDDAWTDIGFHDLDERVLAVTPAAKLAELQSKYPAGTPQHILAGFEFQRRLTASQIRATYWTCGISAAVGVAAALLSVWLTLAMTQ